MNIAEKFAYLREWVGYCFECEALPAVAVGIYLQGKEDFMYAGVHDTQDKRPIDKHSLFPLYSMTPYISPVPVVLKLIEENLIHVNATIKTYLPNYGTMPNGYNTVYDLIVNAMSTNRGSTHLLEGIIKKVTLINAQEATEKYLTQPLGLSSTSFYPKPPFLKVSPSFYFPLSKKPSDDSIYSNAIDLVEFGKSLLAFGPLPETFFSCKVVHDMYFSSTNTLIVKDRGSLIIVDREEQLVLIKLSNAIYSKPKDKMSPAERDSDYLNKRIFKIFLPHQKSQ